MSANRHLLRYVLGLGLILVLLGHAVQIQRIGLIDRLDAIFHDAKLRLTMPGGIDDRVVIVDIDEKSLAEQGRWPWGRDRLATLIDKLFERHGVALVGFDVVFAEPDDSSGLKTLDALAARELHDNTAFRTALDGMRPRLDHDARFAAALAKRPVVLGYYLSNQAQGQSGGVLPAPSLPPTAFAGRPIAFASWRSHSGNLPILQRAAASAGHMNPIVDFDGIVRRVPLLVEYRGEYYEALSLAMLRTLRGHPPVVPGFVAADNAYGGLEWLELPDAGGGLRVPVDENVAAAIPYRGPQGSFPYIAATDILNDRVPVERLRGRIILVGTTAPGLMDLRATPVDAAYPGVEAHANLIVGMLDGTVKHRPEYLLAADVLQIVAVGLTMLLLLSRLSPLRATLLTLTLLAALAWINYQLWSAAHLIMPFAGVFALALLLYTLEMSWGYFVEARAKQRFTALFGQYVPPELVDEMARDPERYSMAGRKADLTVLFSDVRDFTSIAESLSPEQLTELMNAYLGAMTAAIGKRRGTLDKYIGDAIMAFWGAPVGDPEHARHAVLAALDMQAALLEFNRTCAAQGWPELRIGIGVNTGDMTVGDMGSRVRKAYTVMGDPVNLGARLESITKYYGVGIILGAATCARLGEEFVLRELDRVRVKGKAEPVTIYEPLGLAGQVGADKLAELEFWRCFLAAYRTQDWDLAESLLRDSKHVHSRPLYELYIARIIRYRNAPPGADWDGVTTFETK